MPSYETNNPNPMFQNLVEISFVIHEFIQEELPTLAYELFWNIFVPLAVTVLLCGVTLKAFLIIYKIICPPSAAELHKEALMQLEGSNDSSSYYYDKNDNHKKTAARRAAIQKSEQQAEALLKKAMQRDPTFEPAVLSLAALYVYRQKRPQQALAVLEPYEKKKTNRSKHGAALDAVRQDAQAMLQGHENMVQSELAETEYLSVLATVAR